jgi:threonine/homoserine/homoserine lactone efflux protein
MRRAGPVHNLIRGTGFKTNLMDFLLRGFIIGLSIAAPVGPIGVLCIRRTLAEGRLAGFVSGMGAATADMLYGSVAAFGLTAISNALVDQQVALRLIGGAFLIWLGTRTFFTTPAGNPVQIRQGGLFITYIATFFLTLTNPATILSFAAIFSGFGLVQENPGYAGATQMVTGVFLGSSAWWLGLSLGVGILREKFNSVGMKWINRFSGMILLLFGLAALASIWLVY